MSNGLMHKSDPVISIIIPVFNDVHGLTITIDSLKQQSSGDDLFEIIVANDGGDEAIAEYCKESSITCVDIVPGKGSYNARNEAIRIAAKSTSYLAFIDADIVADKDWVKNGLKHLQEYDYVAGDVKIPRELVNDIATFHDYLTAFPMKSYFVEYGFGGAGNLFINKNVIEKVGPFNTVLRSGGDLEFGKRTDTDKSIRKFFAEDCILFHAPRTHTEKVIKIKRVKQGHKDLLTIDSDRFAFLKKNKIGIKSILPPRWSEVKGIYQFDEKFGKWQLYLYLYRLKLVRLFINLIP